MGMRLRRCPRCKKRRRFSEGAGSSLVPSWGHINGLYVCAPCVARTKTEEKK
jgi:hypothetical protein